MEHIFQMHSARSRTNAIKLLNKPKADPLDDHAPPIVATSVVSRNPGYLTLISL